MTDELKPCPFCQKKKLLSKTIEVICLNCGARGPFVEYASSLYSHLIKPVDSERAVREKAVDLWNKRAEKET